MTGALSAVEQEELPEADGIEDLLARIARPDQVAGCAIAVERIVVPPEAERDLPEDDGAALQAVADHPDRADVRLLVAVTRDGSADACCASATTTATTGWPSARHRPRPGARAAATFED